jgi:hypothetical protein
MFGMLPMLFSGYSIVTIGRLREAAIMVIFPLPSAL